MRYIQIHEDEKVPVAKNVAFAMKLIWKADKRLLTSSIISIVADQIFGSFIRSVLFLKALLTIIDGGDFKEYVLTLILFAVVSIFCQVIHWKEACTRDVKVKVVLKKINNMIFKKAAELDVGCYEDPEFYDKYQRATLVLSAGYFDLICWDIAYILSGVITLVFVLSTVASIDPKYLLFLLPMALIFVIELRKSRAVYKRDLEMTTNNRLKAYIQRTMYLKEYSKDMRTSNIFSVMMKRFEASVKSNVKILKNYGVKLFIFSIISSFFSEFIPTIGTYALAGWQFVFKKSLSISGFSVVLSSINSVRSAIYDITFNIDEFVQMALYFQNLKDFFEYEPKIQSGDKTATKFESLEFKNVTFKYPGAEHESLKNVSFKITNGETVALVGVNGAGKSTIVKLMLRFYDPSEGEVLLNGINLKEYELESLRNLFATVFQDYKNFAVSVFENIICHECDEESKKLAQKALEQSGVWDKIKNLPLSGDTVLTKEFDENGVGLSGGENQKVSTARLFARDFDFAILDEPSSALDPIAEYKMYENLVEVTKDRTVLYISHRLSSAALSDRIIVIGDGTVLEIGTHEELLANNGKYAEMFRLQASSYNSHKGGDENE